ncbi:hypothetical protein SAMN05444172_8996 [Burkholderia sp. GAS332]|nr:hypothetical protein SAMN05444172_8996 [Burkholderia sp. GAS332]
MPAIGYAACLRFELRIMFDRAHKDCKNASRSALGFHGFVIAGSMPAFFQNTCMASRFICRFIVMYRPVVAKLVWPR